MRIVLQRVKEAQVIIDNQFYAEIARGLLLLVCIEKSDTEKEVNYLAEKVVNLRVFADEHEKMNLSVQEVGGEILSVSQFTLAADVGRGRRPDFFNAASPGQAIPLYERFNSLLRRFVAVKEGRFGALMQIKLINDGPVTLFLEKRF